MSATPLDSLLELLAFEERIYRELRTLLKSERDSLMSLDADTLADLALRKETLAVEGRLAEESRVAAAEALAQTLGVRERPVTLWLLCSQMGEEGQRLREAQTRLIALLGAIRELSDANRILGGEKLKTIQSTLQLLGRLVPAASQDGFEDASSAAPSKSGRLLQTSA